MASEIYTTAFELRVFVSSQKFLVKRFLSFNFSARRQDFPWGKKKKNNIIFQLILVVRNVMFL